MADDSMAIQPSDPSGSMVTGDPISPQPSAPSDTMVQPESTPGYGSLAAQVLAQQNAQNPPPPAGLTDPMHMPTAQPYMSTPTSPDVKEHMDWIHRAVNATANALAGPTSWQVTKLPDGTVTSTPMPSTPKEKWGQIAAAALTGASQGFLNSQGPGGLGRAAAAGVQAGMKQPQQQKEQSQQDADFQNKQMMSNANRIHIGQQTYMLAAQTKMANLQYDEATTKALNDSTEMLANSPGAVDLGTIDPTNHDDLVNLSKTNPDVMPAIMGQGDKIMRYVPQPDHKVRLIMTDKGWEQQRNTKPVDIPVLSSKDGKPVTAWQSVPVNGATNGEIATTTAAHVLQIGTAQKNQADIDAKEATANKPAPLSKTPAETRAAASAARAAGKTAEADRLDQLAEQQIRDEQRMHPPKAAKAGAGDVADAAAAGPAQIRANGGSIEDALNAIPIADRGNVKAMGEGRMAPPNRATKEGLRQTAMVNAVYPDWDATQFKTYQDARTRFTSGKEGDGLAFILTARNHLARMANNIPPNVSIPFGVGSVVNWAKNASQQSTDPKLKAFYDDLQAVGSEVAAAYKGGVVTDAEHDRMDKLLNGTDSPDAMKGAINEFNQLLAGKASSYQEQWNAAMPRGVASPNGLLEKAVSGAITAPTDGNKVQWPKAPAPQGQVYAYLPGHPVTPIPKGNAKQFLQDHPEGQVNQQ